jgi:hypothetical protein
VWQRSGPLSHRDIRRPGCLRDWVNPRTQYHGDLAWEHDIADGESRYLSVLSGEQVGLQTENGRVASCSSGSVTVMDAHN